ncbi:hypothetical protein F5Y19DRAFT_419466 [Xylariaceae sp. FL1651]|nr:hypothetical protein F5Y19DRAFT_419466 [Xylariaceae sp. FL1651]
MLIWVCSKALMTRPNPDNLLLAFTAMRRREEPTACAIPWCNNYWLENSRLFNLFHKTTFFLATVSIAPCLKLRAMPSQPTGPVTPYITNGQNFSSLIPPPTEINNSHKDVTIAVLCIILGIIGSLSVIARLTYRFGAKNQGADDYLIIPALILYIGWTALSGYICLNGGIGKPPWEVTLAEFSIWYKGLLAGLFYYPIMSATIRASILLFYRRVFATRVNRPGEIFIWTMMGLQVAYVIVFTILPGFICTPLHYEWEPIQRLGHCSVKYYYLIQEALYGSSFGFDVILLLFPIIPVSRLQMSLKRRLGVISIFLLGASATVAAAYRLGIFVQATKIPARKEPFYLQYQVSRYIPGQFPETGTDFYIPSQLEPTVALLGTSLPALMKAFGSIKLQLSHLASSSLFSGTSSRRPSDDGPFKSLRKSSSANHEKMNSEVELKAAVSSHSSSL